GRLLPKASQAEADASAKYINSPDGPLYNKSTALFGLSHAKEGIREQKNIILVEGYFDVLACHKVGVRNVVAVSGTALTEQHALILKRYAPRITLCLDADRAGRDAAERAYLLARKQDITVHVVSIPQGKDPDECALKTPVELKASLESSGEPYLTSVFESMRTEKTEKREALRRIIPLLQCIPSAVEKEQALREAAGALETSVTALQDDLRRSEEPRPLLSTNSKKISEPYSTTELFLGLLLAYPENILLAEKLIEPESASERALQSAIRSLPNTPGATVSPSMLPQEAQERASILLLYCEEHFGSWSADLAGKELRKLLQKANRDLLHAKQKHLLERIRDARRDGKKVEEEQLLTQYQKVLKLTALAR
ncbi:MAG: toprim domain-containing protein, partial [Patescibacteria group bacterium]